MFNFVLYFLDAIRIQIHYYSLENGYRTESDHKIETK